MIKLQPDKLQEYIYNEFINIGVSENSARNAATSMVQTSTRGVDSHGINLFPHYHRSFILGRLNKNPSFNFIQNKPAVAVLDADDAIGHESGIVAMDKCLELAKKEGIGACTVKNSSHYGASSYFGLHAAKQGFIGMAFTNADALVKAFNGVKSFFGTNPICFCAPLKSEEPLCLDMATSLVSWNKIKNYRREEKELEDGWAYNSEGQSVNNPHQAASLSPAGDYKGYGLGMMIEVFCALLGGSVIGKDMLAMFTSPPEAKRKVSHFFMAIDIEAFINKQAFIDSLQSMVDRIRAEAKLGESSVMAPGDPEKIEFKSRIKTGIPVLDEVFNEYLAINPNFKECIQDPS